MKKQQFSVLMILFNALKMNFDLLYYPCISLIANKIIVGLKIDI